MEQHQPHPVDDDGVARTSDRPLRSDFIDHAEVLAVEIRPERLPRLDHSPYRHRLEHCRHST
jgi:hypothetical protein